MKQSNLKNFVSQSQRYLGKILILILLISILISLNVSAQTCVQLQRCKAIGSNLYQTTTPTLGCASQATTFATDITLGYIPQSEIQNTVELQRCEYGGYAYQTTIPALGCTGVYSTPITLGYIFTDETSCEDFLSPEPPECRDSDNDGFGLEDSDLTSCSGSTTKEDCDDRNHLIFPTNPNTYCDCEKPYTNGVAEICNDGIDNDCDDLIDSNDPSCDIADCTDTDATAGYPNGVNPYLQGTFEFQTDGCSLFKTFYKRPAYKIPSCTPQADPDWSCGVEEYYCNDVDYIDCPNGCENGACIPEEGAPPGAPDCSTINCADYDKTNLETCETTVCCSWYPPTSECRPSDPEALYCNPNSALHTLEECDPIGPVFRTDQDTCIALGYAGGTLSCNNFCELDTTQCYVGEEICADIQDCSDYSLDLCQTDDCAVSQGYGCYVLDEECTLCDIDTCSGYSTQGNCDLNSCGLTPACLWDEFSDPPCMEISTYVDEQGQTWDCSGQTWGSCVDGVRTTSGSCSGEGVEAQQLSVPCRVTKEFPFFSSKGIIIVLVLLVGYYIFINYNKKK